jgi:hypothetical protein
MVYTESCSDPHSNNNLPHRRHNKRICSISPTRTYTSNKANDSGKHFNPVTSCPISSDQPYSCISLIYYINAIDVRARYPPCTNPSRRHLTEMHRGGSSNLRSQDRRLDKSLDLDKGAMCGMMIRTKRGGSRLGMNNDVLTIS